MDCSPPGSSVHGIFQARILEWLVISSLRGSCQPRDQTHISSTGWWLLYHWATREAHEMKLSSDKYRIYNYSTINHFPPGRSCVCMLSCFSCIQLFVTIWIAAHQAPLSMGFTRQYWSGLLCPLQSIFWPRQKSWFSKWCTCLSLCVQNWEYK